MTCHLVIFGKKLTGPKKNFLRRFITENVDIFFPFKSTRDTLHAIIRGTFMLFAVQNPCIRFIFSRVLKPDKLEGAFQRRIFELLNEFCFNQVV